MYDTGFSDLLTEVHYKESCLIQHVAPLLLVLTAGGGVGATASACLDRALCGYRTCSFLVDPHGSVFELQSKPLV